MIFTYHEGDLIKQDIIEKFDLRKGSDLRNFRDEVDFNNLFGSCSRLNFSGFIFKGDDALVSFPKQFKIDQNEVKKDSRLLFSVFQKHKKSHPSKYIGRDNQFKYESDYPFSAFFRVWDYYQKYGLYFENIELLRPNAGGKVDWKATFKKADRFINNGDPFYYPLLYRKKKQINAFLTECMIYVIDKTISRFHFILPLQPTGKDFPSLDFERNPKSIAKRLLEIRSFVYKDSLIALVDALIEFFNSVNVGGRHVVKHYSFANVWEDMGLSYLNKFFAGYSSGGILFSQSRSVSYTFAKRVFYSDYAHPTSNFQPDYYLDTPTAQYIFDAKYYSSVSGMMYKELVYLIFLKQMNSNSIGNNSYKPTYACLILPSAYTHSSTNFRMNSSFSKSLQDVKIDEQYLDIKDVMRRYLEK